MACRESIEVANVDDGWDAELACKFDRGDSHREGVGVNDLGMVGGKLLAEADQTLWIEAKVVGG